MCGAVKQDWHSGKRPPNRTEKDLPTQCSVLPKRPCAPRAAVAGTDGNTRHLSHQTFCCLFVSFWQVWSIPSHTSLPSQASLISPQYPPDPSPLHPNTPTQGAPNAVDGPGLVAFLACLSRRRAFPLPPPQTPPPCFFLLHFSPAFPCSAKGLGRHGLVLFRPQQHRAGPAPAFCTCHHQ